MIRLSAKKSRTIALITAIGALSLYLLVSRAHLRPKSASAAETPVATSPVSSSGLEATASRPRSLTPQQAEAWRLAASAGWPEDPFTPTERYASRDADVEPRAADSVESHEFVLNAVMRGEPSLAMIDGRIVAVGDRIGGEAIVEKIGDYTVRVRVPEGVRVLRIID